MNDDSNITGLVASLVHGGLTEAGQATLMSTQEQLTSSLLDSNYLNESMNTLSERQSSLARKEAVLQSGILDVLPSAAEARMLLQNEEQVLCDKVIDCGSLESVQLENEIFSDVSATISGSFLQMLPETQYTFLEKLQLNATVCYEDKENGGAACMLRGNLQQIIEAQKFLETLLLGSSLNMHCQKTVEDSLLQENKVSGLKKMESCDKAIMCDIIKLDKLSHFAMEHPRKARFSSLLLRQSAAARMAVKNKFRFHRKVVKVKKKKCSMNAITALASSDNRTIPSTTDQLTTFSDVHGVNSTPDIENFESVNNEELSDKNRPNTLVSTGASDCNAQHPEAPMEEAQLMSVPSPLQREEFDMDVTIQRKSRRVYEELTPYKFFCKRCSFKTKRESHYEKHLLIHDKVKTLYNCESCSFTTIRLSHLRRHEMSHSQTTYNCDQCTYKTDEMKLLARHVKLKHKSEEEQPAPSPQELLQCSQCPYNTTYPYHYKRHLRVHNSEVRNSSRVYQCNQCPYKTYRKEHYIRHVNNVHSNKRPHLCDICGNSFKRPDALKQHLRATHGGADAKALQFSCCVCDKKCRSQAHLTEHQAVHSNIRSYLCEVCGASFKTRSVQRKHIATIHKNPRAHSCKHCDRRFNTNYALRRHLRLHSDENGTDGKKVAELLPSLHETLILAVPEFTVAPNNALSFTLQQDDPSSSSPAHLTFSAPRDSLPLPVTDGAAFVTIEESFVQGEDALSQDQQAFVQPAESTTALLYLTSNFNQF